VVAESDRLTTGNECVKGLDHYENMSIHMLDRDPERSLNRYTGLRWVAVQ
jgi:hypothetical protein